MDVYEALKKVQIEDSNPFLNRESHAPTYQRYDPEWPYEWPKPRSVQCG